MSMLRRFILCLMLIFLTLPLKMHAEEKSEGDNLLKTTQAKLNVLQVKEHDVESCYLEEPLSNKILDALQTKINEQKLNKNQEKIEVSIMLRYDASISKDVFVTKNDNYFIDSITDIDGFGVYSFFAKLTIEQINKLAGFEEISSISTIDDVQSTY